MSVRRREMMALGAAIFADIRLGENPQTVVRRHASVIRGLFQAFAATIGDSLPDKAVDTIAISISQTAAMWAECGFPLVVASHRLAASLMASQIHASSVGDVAMPWPCFSVAVPDGLLSGLEHHRAGPSCVQHVGMMDVGRHSDMPIRIWFQTERTGVVISHRFRSIAELADAAENSKGIYERDEPQMRSVQLLSRLLLGVCIELDSPARKIEISNGPPKPKAKHGRAPEPKAWTFQLTRDVKVDCREWVTRYLRGEDGTSPSVQTLVRGHHKRQAHGPGGTLRKWIHVEPYWRGPEDAPIAVRSHKLEGRP